MPEIPGGLEIGVVREDLQNPVKLIEPHGPVEVRARVDHQTPRVHLVETAEDLLRMVPARVDQRRVELTAAPCAQHRYRRVGSAGGPAWTDGGTEHLGIVGHLHDPHHHLDLFTSRRTRHSLSVPSFECLTQSDLHPCIHAETLCDVTGGLAMGHEAVDSIPETSAQEPSDRGDPA